MEREGLARAGRRRQALEAVEFERARSDALRERLEVLVTELDGPAIDDGIFVAMRPEQVEVVRPELQPVDLEPTEPEELEGEDVPRDEPSPEPVDHQEAEIERLQGEIASSVERQRAFERYLELLGE